MVVMMENKLLNSHKNEIFEVIQQSGLNPSDFKWVGIISKFPPNTKVSKLIHQPTEHYFIFDLKNNKHWAEYSPGKETWTETQYPGSWEFQKSYVMGWLDCLKKESMPDLWEAISKENILDESRFSDNDSPFNPEEKEQISKRLYEIERHLISTQNLSEEHEEVVRARLNYLEESSKRQNRRDWLHTMIGVFFTIIVGIGMSSSAANELFNFASHSFNNIFGPLSYLKTDKDKY